MLSAHTHAFMYMHTFVTLFIKSVINIMLIVILLGHPNVTLILTKSVQRQLFSFKRLVFNNNVQ